MRKLTALKWSNVLWGQHAAMVQWELQDGVQQSEAYAVADSTSKPAAWLWDPPGSGQLRRQQADEGSFSIWLGPPQHITVAHDATKRPCWFLWSMFLVPWHNEIWDACDHMQSVLLPDALVMPLGFAASGGHPEVSVAIWGHVEI